MGTLISLTMAIVALVVVFYPLFQQRRSAQPTVATEGDATSALEGESAWENLIAQRDEVYIAIKDLEFDYMADKLTDEDYQELKEKYEAEAILMLQQIEEFGEAENSRPMESYQTTPIQVSDELVEAEIQRFKERKGNKEKT